MGVSEPGFQDSRGERGRAELLPPAWRTSPVALGLCVGCCLLGPCFLTFLHGRSQFARFISLLSPRAPQQQSDRPRVPTQPDNPRLSTPALAPSLALPQGLSPPVVDTAGWQQKAIAAGQGPSVFRAPLSFYGPLGCVVLPLSDRLREETRLGDPKTTNPCIPRDEGERGMVLGISGAQRLEVGTNKRNGGERLCLLCGGIYTSPTFLSNRHHKPPRHCCIQLRERSTTCQRSQSPPVVEMKLNRLENFSYKASVSSVKKMRFVYPREKKNWDQLERSSCSKESVVGRQLDNDMKL